MISTQNTSHLPNINRLKQICQSIALLDAIIMADWEYRYFSFQKHWDKDIDLFTLRNGSGDDVLVIFTSMGALIKGFAHESRFSPYQFRPPKIVEGILDSIPEAFSEHRNEPAFMFENTTFCLWRLNNDIIWQHGKIPEFTDEFGDGSEYLLTFFEDSPTSYYKYAKAYYEQEIDLASIQAIYEHKAITQALVNKINPSANLIDLMGEIMEIGYPTEEGGSS